MCGHFNCMQIWLCAQIIVLVHGTHWWIQGAGGEGGASGNPHSHFTLMPDVGGCGFPQMKVPLAWMYITSAHWDNYINMALSSMCI